MSTLLIRWWQMYVRYATSPADQQLIGGLTRNST